MRTQPWMLLWLCLAALAAGGALAQPDPHVGILRGTVTFEDGTPYAHAGLYVMMDGRREEGINAETDDRGEYACQLPPGTGTVNVRDVQQRFTMQEGVATTANLMIQRAGLVLDVRYPDGTPLKQEEATVQLMGAYRTPAARCMTYGEYVAGGQWWFADMPRDATYFSAIVLLGNENIRVASQQRWPFTRQEPLRKVSMTVKRNAALTLRLVDDQGTPLRATSARVRVAFRRAGNLDSGYWADCDAQRAEAHTRWEGITSAEGSLPPQTVPGGTYEVTVFGEEAAARPLTVTVDGDTTVTVPVTLKVRDVTQTVFGQDGRPAAGAEVYAAYAWKGEGAIVRGTANADGVVVWKQLPPTRVIVWGPAVPGGVLPPDAVHVTAPLPTARVDAQTLTLTLAATNPGPQPATFTCLGTGIQFNGAPSLEYDPAGAMVTDDKGKVASPRSGQVEPAFCATATPGGRFTVAIGTPDPSPRLGTLADVYCPYSDDTDSLALKVTLHDATTLHGRLMAPGLPAVPGVSRLEIAPLNVPTAGPLGDDIASLKAIGLCAPIIEADGTFTVALPAPGDYRLLVDLFDQTVPAPPELLVTVGEHEPLRTIVLPAPLLTVPAGTQLYWLTPQTPAEAATLVAAAHAPTMPVFGPRQGLLALWYRPAADTLVVWDTTANRAKETLALRHARFAPTTPEGAPCRWDVALQGLFPEAHAETWLERQAGFAASCWPGRYAYQTAKGWTVAEVPAAGGASVPLRRVPALTPPASDGRRQIIVELPGADYEALRGRAAQSISIHFDVPWRHMLANSYELNDGTWYLNVPADARSMTVTWLGVGVLRDLPIPANSMPDTNETRVRAKRWEPGGTLQVKVLNADGTPYANSPLSVLQWQNSDRDYVPDYLVTTGAEGQATLIGTSGEVISLTINRMPGLGGAWAVPGPSQGTQTVTLRIGQGTVVFRDPQRLRNEGDNGYPAHPGRFGMDDGLARVRVAKMLSPALRRRGATASEKDENAARWESAAWWVPAQGQPVRLAWRADGWASSEVAPGPGTVWITDDTVVHYRKMVAAQGEFLLPETPGFRPSLGLIFPFVEEGPVLGMVTLAGEGQMAGLTMRVTPRWVPCPALGMIAAQLEGVVPGDYRVTVDTSAGPVEGQVRVTAEGGTLRLGYR